MEQLEKWQTPMQLLEFVKRQLPVFYFDTEKEQQKWVAATTLDLYKNGQQYKTMGVQIEDVLLCHYQAANQGLSLLNGDYTIVRFGGKNPKPVAFTSYQRQRADVLSSPNVREFYPRTIWKGASVQQRDILKWEIKNPPHTGEKYGPDGTLKFDDILGFEFVLVRVDGEKYNYFSTVKDILLEIGKDEKMLFAYKKANGETMWWKFVMRKLLKWLPFDLNTSKDWRESFPTEKEVIPETLGVSVPFEVIGTDLFKQQQQQQQEQGQGQEQQQQEQEQQKPWLNIGTLEWDAVLAGISEGSILSVADVRSKYAVSRAVAEELQKFFL